MKPLRVIERIPRCSLYSKDSIIAEYIAQSSNFIFAREALTYRWDYKVALSKTLQTEATKQYGLVT